MISMMQASFDDWESGTMLKRKQQKMHLYRHNATGSIERKIQTLKILLLVNLQDGLEIKKAFRVLYG